jgi:hypothetical protein
MASGVFGKRDFVDVKFFERLSIAAMEPGGLLLQVI